MAAHIKNFQFTVPMPADSTASSYLGYVQLPFWNGMMYIFQTFTATPEDWTALFALVVGDHTIVIPFNLRWSQQLGGNTRPFRHPVQNRSPKEE
uniref:Uncharacterized protein n=1 Tax=Romanomermis culicivorax TaxID=13658 RepID=A0A915I4V9_ROMCU